MSVTLYNIEPLLREGLNTINNLRCLNLRALTLKDVITLVGLSYTAGKGIIVCWQLWKAVKQHGISKVMRPNLKKKYGKWAVVTGCSRGLGSAYVNELAACGLNIVLITLRDETLSPFANKIEMKFKVKTCIIKIDLAKYDEIYDTISDGINGKEIGILVNNVGIGQDTPDYFLDISEERLLGMININIIAVCAMTHMILPQMIERGKGAIVAMVSSCADTPCAEVSVYGATKAYVDYFFECLRQEYSDQGITIQVLKPYSIADGKVENIIPGAKFFAPTPEKYARAAISTLGWSECSTGYWLHTVQKWLRSALPQKGRQMIDRWANELLRQSNKCSEETKSNVDVSMLLSMFG